MRFQYGLLLGSLLAGQVIASPAEPFPRRQSSTLTNPILWEDTPDIDPFRVGDVFYYSSSTFAYSPGAPLYKSYDLANWTPVTHSVPTLGFASKYNLNSATDRAYVKGIWASTARYRNSTDTWYWIGCVEGKTYIYTATGTGAGKNGGEVPTGNWGWKQAATIGTCYYDCGLLIDDDDTMYVAYGNRQLHVAQLAWNGLSEVKNQQVYDSGSTYLEGSHMYKAKGYYWIVPTKVASGEYVLRSKSPFGPYEAKLFFDNVNGPVSNAGRAHQGGWLSIKDDKYYYIAFLDSYPSGRIPVVAPMIWGSDNWPVLTLVNGAWGTSYPMPVSTTKTVPAPTGTDYFNGTSLGQEWEFNHNPDTSKFSVNNGVTLSTATVTDDLFTARNTLTHRAIGPKSQATFQFDISKMADGDRAGAVLFRDQSAYIGIHKSGSNAQIVYVNNLTLGSNWVTQSKGSVAATGPSVTGSTVYFRITSDLTPAYGQSPNRASTFRYSLDGTNWTQLGGDFLVNNDWTYFTGYRYSAFNFATKSLGGSVLLKSFNMVNV